MLAATVLAAAISLPAATYNVGPGQPLTAVGQVPWEALQPGDTVLIHGRPEPYREKFVLCRAGRADAPITVRGVPGADGQLPVIDGDGAITRTNLSYWGDVRSVIKIGGARIPADTMPQYLVLENLDVRGARPPHMFTGADGKPRNYVKNAAAITVEKAEHLTIRNCRLHDSGNGLFVSSNDERASRDLLVEGCHIFDNGIEGSGLEHNVYTAASGTVFQYNRLGPLRAGCPGNNFKDRSAGLEFRYNWVEGGNKGLDLVDAQDSKLIRADPRYRDTWVYGNVLLKLPRDGHSFIAHYGGDGDKLSQYRKGTLHFFNNTIVYYRGGATILLRLSSNQERCEFRNNLVWTTVPGKRVVVLENKGTVELSHNWFKPDWKPVPGKNPPGVVHDDGTSVTGNVPGFVDFANQDFHLTADSPCQDAGLPLPQPAATRQYVRHQSGEPRPAEGRPDIGAFEFAPGK
jgi:hypothetical protein